MKMVNTAYTIVILTIIDRPVKNTNFGAIYIYKIFKSKFKGLKKLFYSSNASKEDVPTLF